jgi:hypothetical protein
MVTHLVVFKINDPTPENLQKTKEKLLSMEGNVPQLRYLEVGIDQLRAGRSYDIMLLTRFESWDDAEGYQKHPFHQEIIKYMHEAAASAVAIDYEE